jgi:ABC-2 type transport system permease protein
MSAYANAALAVLRRDATIFFSYRFRVLATLLSSFFSITLFHFVSKLVRHSAFPTHEAYFAYATVGLVILAVLNSTLAGPPMLARQELVAGTFERLYVSPFGPIGALLGALLFPLVYSLISATVLLAFSGIVFGLPLHWSTAPLALPLGMLGALSFMPFGIFLLAGVILVKQAATGTTWVIALISLIGGLYVPVSILPGWIRWASDVQPFTPATELLRHVLVDTPLTSSAATDLLKVVGFTVVLLPAALALLRGAIAVGRRRGTLVEY